MKSALAQTKRKSASKPSGPPIKKPKVGETSSAVASPPKEFTWVYTGPKNQKTVKLACKDFGLSYKGVSNPIAQHGEFEVFRNRSPNIC